LTAGLRTGSISFPVTYGNGKTTILTASFSGTGVAPTYQVLVDPVTAEFNAEVAGTLDTTNELTFTVSNAGTGPVKMTSSAVTSNFTVTNDQCSGKTIGPVTANYTNAATSCTITVASTPLATAAHGFVQGALSITDGAGTQQVTLQGFTLTAAQLLTLSQSTASFGAVQPGFHDHGSHRLRDYRLVCPQSRRGRHTLRQCHDHSGLRAAAGASTCRAGNCGRDERCAGNTAREKD
jgi:hypothetical protein